MSRTSRLILLLLLLVAGPAHAADTVYRIRVDRWTQGDERGLGEFLTAKRAWYDAQQRLRNQTERTYEARMDFSLDELRAGGSVGESRSDKKEMIGTAAPPNTDARAVLLAALGAERRR